MGVLIVTDDLKKMELISNIGKCQMDDENVIQIVLETTTKTTTLHVDKSIVLNNFEMS